MPQCSLALLWVSKNSAMRVTLVQFIGYVKEITKEIAITGLDTVVIKLMAFERKKGLYNSNQYVLLNIFKSSISVCKSHCTHPSI